jgi:hypothetical protein
MIIFAQTLKTITMEKKPLNLSNSIYQQRTSGNYSGLTVKDGMLINQRPTAETGIKQVCDARKASKRAEKVSMQVEAITQAEMINGITKMFGC